MSVPSYPMRLADVQVCPKCQAKKGVMCKTPSCPQLKQITYTPVLGAPKITRAPGIPADLSIDKVPMFMTHRVVELHNGWFLGHGGDKTIQPGQSANLNKLIIGNRFTGDMFFVELKALNKLEVETAMSKMMVALNEAVFSD